MFSINNNYNYSSHNSGSIQNIQQRQREYYPYLNRENEWKMVLYTFLYVVLLLCLLAGLLFGWMVR